MRDILDDIFRVGNMIRRTTNPTTRDNSISQLCGLYDTFLELYDQKPEYVTDDIQKQLVDLFRHDYSFLSKHIQKKYLTTFTCLKINCSSETIHKNVGGLLCSTDEGRQRLCRHENCAVSSIRS
jgi:hypothetical protein